MSTLWYEVPARLLFVLHMALAAFVAGGTGWLVLIGSRGRARDGDVLATTLRDWLPFGLGLAITFGIGPLLFVQLRDSQAFYTANLLLSHRFLVVLPALITGFYLLYLQKAKWRWVGTPRARLLVPLLAFLCFGFTAWSLSENHLLAQSRSSWTDVYARGPGFFWHRDLVPRLIVFAGVAMQVAALGLAWAMPQPARAASARRLAAASIGGAVLVAVGLAVHERVVGVDLLGPTLLWLPLAEILLLLLACIAVRTRNPSRAWATLLTAVVLERGTELREAIRLARGGVDEFAAHANAHGLPLFLVVACTVTAAIAWAIRRVRAECRGPG